MGAKMTFTGMGDLMDRLDAMVTNADKVKAKALQLAAEPILEEARRTTAFHDRTGLLRKSLTTTGVKFSGAQGKNGYKLIGTFGENVTYAKFVEFGHSSHGKGYTSAHPFLQPAFINKKAEAEQIIIDTLKEALK